MRTVIVNAATTAIAHTGHAMTLPAGTYEVAELDGVAERGELFITGPGGALVQVDPNGPNIAVRCGDDDVMTANALYPMRVDLAEVRARGREAARHLQAVDGVLPAVFGAHLSGDVGQMMQEIEYLRARLGEVRDERVDPALLRWCDWPGCWRSFDATTGPVGEPGWMHHHHPTTLLCPTHDPAGHRPDFTWTNGDNCITALCECGASEQVRPTNQRAVAEWWTSHVQEATR